MALKTNGKIQVSDLPIQQTNIKNDLVFYGVGELYVAKNDIPAGSFSLVNWLRINSSDPKNFITRDTSNEYNYKKHIIDYYFQSYTSSLTQPAIALRCGSIDAEKRSRFWFLFQKFGNNVGGMGNSSFFDGVFYGIQYETNKQVSLNNAGAINIDTYSIR